jgi:hypothetical protein
VLLARDGRRCNRRDENIAGIFGITDGERIWSNRAQENVMNEQEPIKTHDAEGNPVLVTEEQTDAGTALHVEPDPDAEGEGEESADKSEAEHEDAETGKKGTQNTVDEDDDDDPF